MFRERDLNVTLPTSDDFPQPCTSAMVFCAMTRLCMQISKVQEMSTRQVEVETTDIADATSSLKSWMHNLPAGLRLYDDLGRRQSWSRPVVELHIFYFICIILIYLLPGAHRRSEVLGTASIVASSCALRLYEEILHREQVPYLLAIHSWTTLVAAIPQKHCLIRHSNLSAACAEELDIGRAILLQMREKYTSADTALQKFDSLQQADSVGCLQPNPLPANRRNGAVPARNDGPHMGSWEDRCDVASLFPFPESFSAKMLLLGQQPCSGSDETSEDILSLEASMGQDTFSWPNDLLNLDILDMNHIFPSGAAFSM